MASTSAAELASNILAQVLERSTWPEEDLRKLVQLAADDPAASGALFGTLVERLGDLFEPRLNEIYARIFAQAIEWMLPGVRADDLVARYEQIRQVNVCRVDPEHIFVLSRVTLGADVAVTSVVIDGLKKRFPGVPITFAGPRKNFELFEADGRILHLPVEYKRRGTLRDRIDTWPVLKRQLDQYGTIVVDPDSRLTQLGLLPVGEPDRYFFFESRGYGSDTNDALPQLTSRWVAETFGTTAAAFIAPAPAVIRQDICVSLGVGDNPEKRVADPFEREWLKLLSAKGSVLVDKGGGTEEPSRVERTVEGLSGVGCYEGPYAPFAARIARSRLYAGYDSAGQHVAAACSVPLISIFAGAASDRMFERWKPWGTGPRAILRVQPGESSAQVLERVQGSLENLVLRWPQIEK